MSDPIQANLAALALAEALIKMLTEQVAASFEKRIADLEAKVEIMSDSTKFDEAVMEAIGSDPGAVVAAIEDELKIRDDDKIADAVSDVIRSGSFSVEFSRY